MRKSPGIWVLCVRYSYYHPYHSGHPKEFRGPPEYKKFKYKKPEMLSFRRITKNVFSS
jgi:hypothetical protein